MKKILFLSSLFLLSGCIYNGDCWVPIIQTVGDMCVREEKTPYPIIALYQKKNNIGHTDSRQRIEDIKACGADENLRTFSKGYKAFRECLELKGYIRLEPNDCGYQEPKFSTGKCNI